MGFRLLALGKMPHQLFTGFCADIDHSIFAPFALTHLDLSARYIQIAYIQGTGRDKSHLKKNLKRCW
jgi:hypothetical protein